MVGGSAASGAAGAGSEATEGREEAFSWQAHKEELHELPPFLWPKRDPSSSCVSWSGLFSSAPLCNVASPIALKLAIDAVTSGHYSIGAIVGYGMLRFGGNFFNELKDNAFAFVSTHASRKISLRTFTHVMDPCSSFTSS